MLDYVDGTLFCIVVLLGLMGSRVAKQACHISSENANVAFAFMVEVEVRIKLWHQWQRHQLFQKNLGE